MSERGAEGILAQRRADAAKAAAAQPQPVDSSTAGHTPGRAKGAAAGAAKGALEGPGGAFLGGLAGGLAGGSKGRSGGSKPLVAEFAICMLILLLSPLISGGGDITPGKFLKKGSATAGVFIILGFLSATGDSARKVANGLGALMTLTILLNERSVFGQLVKAVNGGDVAASFPGSGSGSTSTGGATTPAGNPESTQESLELGGGIAADAGTAVNRWVRALFGDTSVAPLPGVPNPSTDPTGYLQLFGAGD